MRPSKYEAHNDTTTTVIIMQLGFSFSFLSNVQQFILTARSVNEFFAPNSLWLYSMLVGTHNLCKAEQFAEGHSQNT